MSLTLKTVDFIKSKCDVNLKGKTVLITGANSGVGFKTAETMVYLGASVIMACRNQVKAEEARQQLLSEYKNTDVKIMALDLADFSSIDEFVNKLKPALSTVGVFVNNAGLFHHPNQKTKDGFELVMGTNYLGLFYLCEKLLPEFAKTGKEHIIINTTSIVYKIGRVDFKNFYSNKKAYSRSKICLTRYTEHLIEKYKNTKIKIYLNHPGVSATPIASHFLGGLYTLAKLVPINSAEKSSLSVAYILANEIPSGSLVGPNKGPGGGWGFPEVNRIRKTAFRGIDELLEFTKAEVSKVRQL